MISVINEEIKISVVATKKDMNTTVMEMSPTRQINVLPTSRNIRKLRKSISLQVMSFYISFMFLLLIISRILRQKKHANNMKNGQLFLRNKRS